MHPCGSKKYGNVAKCFITLTKKSYMKGCLVKCSALAIRKTLIFGILKKSDTMTGNVYNLQ
jgi:hypothetical protein